MMFAMVKCLLPTALLWGWVSPAPLVQHFIFPLCHPNEYGTKYPDPSNCEFYVECLQGTPIRRPCPAGLHFNSVLSVCDWPYHANCFQNVYAAPGTVAQSQNPPSSPANNFGMFSYPTNYGNEVVRILSPSIPTRTDNVHQPIDTANPSVLYSDTKPTFHAPTIHHGPTDAKLTSGTPDRQGTSMVRPVHRIDNNPQDGKPTTTIPVSFTIPDVKPSNPSPDSPTKPSIPTTTSIHTSTSNKPSNSPDTDTNTQSTIPTTTILHTSASDKPSNSPDTDTNTQPTIPTTTSLHTSTSDKLANSIQDTKPSVPAKPQAAEDPKRGCSVTTQTMGGVIPTDAIPTVTDNSTPHHSTPTAKPTTPTSTILRNPAIAKPSVSVPTGYQKYSDAKSKITGGELSLAIPDTSAGPVEGTLDASGKAKSSAPAQKTSGTVSNHELEVPSSSNPANTISEISSGKTDQQTQNRVIVNDKTSSVTI
ncbi:unnamed protein product [Cyprideis torosa]|uniref:Uncharacterized protein n=1 Tax=Cyprideis torosa TaxID=163714 RepID=A0A7R8WBC1_9CRUS|nr:unnamed protein product [Cyprideis torosa]CAG0886145.1 unnamed protein product [Cyprideis torosa]